MTMLIRVPIPATQPPMTNAWCVSRTHVFNARVNHRLGALAVFGEIRCPATAGTTICRSADAMYLPGYTVLNLGLTYQLHKQVSLLARLNTPPMPSTCWPIPIPPRAQPFCCTQLVDVRALMANAILPGRFRSLPPASGQGKPPVVSALARLHARQGRRVCACLRRARFLDPVWHSLASGAPVYQLDLWINGEADCRARLLAAAQEADLILVEGVMGLFDGDPSAADLAQRFGLPVLAVVDASSMAAPLRWLLACNTSGPT